jgi:signal transduction histidine kinase
MGGADRRCRPPEGWFTVIRSADFDRLHPFGGAEGHLTEDGICAISDYSSLVDELERVWSRWGALLLDIGPVLILAVAMVSIRDPRGDLAAGTLLAVVAPLAFRRRWPLAVLVVVAAGVLATGGRAALVEIPAVALASFTMGDLARDRSRSAIGVLVVAAAMAGGFLIGSGDPFTSIVLPFVILVPSWVVGDFLRGWRADRVAHTAESVRRERERERAVQAAIAEERRSVARELHDVVAHGVSVMLIQAGAARKVLRTAPDQAEQSLLAVEATGREAMSELRTLLGVLADDSEGAGLAPQPGVAQLDILMDRVRQAGLPAELQIDGSRRDLPASLDVAAYRIIQEALTNALRHAQRARTVVHLSYEAQQLRLEVLDDGPSMPGDRDPAEPGRGLLGMNERAAFVGGRFEAGPRLGGGYAVRAWLPFQPESA